MGKDKEDLGIWSLGAWEKEAKQRKPSIEISMRKKDDGWNICGDDIKEHRAVESAGVPEETK